MEHEEKRLQDLDDEQMDTAVSEEYEIGRASCRERV